jgi:hypothetical protein
LPVYRQYHVAGIEAQGVNLLDNCGVMSLPTNEEGYAGALYIFVRRFFLMYKSIEMINAQTMTVPSTAPTTGATIDDGAWPADVDLLVGGVAVANGLCVIVLYEGSAKLNVNP